MVDCNSILIFNGVLTFSTLQMNCAFDFLMPSFDNNINRIKELSIQQQQKNIVHFWSQKLSQSDRSGHIPIINYFVWCIHYS